MYVLTRRLPSGQEKSHSPLPTRRKAAQAAMYVLMDNRLAGKREANTFAASVEDAELGAEVAHEASGYTFRTTRVEAPRG